ncbi:MAG TPA: mannosyltransferase family protein, partial [Thermopolyspora sp.]
MREGKARVSTPATPAHTTPVCGSSGWEALLLWFGSRLGLIVAATVGAALLSGADTAEPFLERWRRWDADLLIKIAQYGYGGDPSQSPDAGLPAFFPGMPMAIRVVHSAVPGWILSGLLISLVAGAIAVVALVRLGDLDDRPGTGWRAVLALLLCPTAVFLFAGYSEALFLAFAIPAWLAARRRNWRVAALLATGASCVRITGLFLALALIVEYASAGDASRDRWRAVWLVPP